MPTRGFTLIEVVLVIMIVGVLAAIAVPRYTRSLSRYHAEAAARRLAADLDYARAAARTRSASQAVTFTLVNSSYELVGLPHPDDPDERYVVRLADDLYNTVLTTFVLAGGGDTVTFDGYGQPDRGGTFTLRSGDTVRTVTLDATSGRATWQ